METGRCDRPECRPDMLFPEDVIGVLSANGGLGRDYFSPLQQSSPVRFNLRLIRIYQASGWHRRPVNDHRVNELLSWRRPGKKMRRHSS